MSGNQYVGAQDSRSVKAAGYFAWLTLFALIGGGWFWGKQHWQEAEGPPVVEAVLLENLKTRFEEVLEKRRWDEAADLIRQMKEAGAGEASLASIRLRVENGRAEERGQEIAFLVFKARVELEEGRLQEAEQYCSRIEKLEAAHPAVPEIREAVETKRREVRIVEMEGPVEDAILGKDWEKAEDLLARFEEAFPKEARDRGVREEFESARDLDLMRREKAARLVADARALDQGVYSEKAIRLLEEAVLLHPSPENQALYRKMSAYGRVLAVPGDYPSIAEALKGAKDNDRIMLARGVYRESLVIPSGVTLVGAGAAETVIECPAEAGAVVTVPPGVKAVRLASLTLRHNGLVNDDERFAVLAIDGGQVEGNDLMVARGSGHGVAVVNGGKITLERSTVSDSGWDGVAVTGPGSSAVLSNVTCDQNLQHGVDFWDGGSGIVTDSVLRGNGLNGFLSLNATDPVALIRTTSEKNREVGVYVSGGVALNLQDCRISGNFLGGVFLGGDSRKVRMERNVVRENGEAGLVVEKGVEILLEKENQVSENEGRQIWLEAVLPEPPDVETGPPPPAPPLETPKKD